MLCEKTFYELSLLSYFDTYAVNIQVSDMIRHIQEDEQLMQDYGQYPDFQNNMKLVRQINPDEYAHMTVKEWYNDNADSGVVYLLSAEVKSWMMYITKPDGRTGRTTSVCF